VRRLKGLDNKRTRFKEATAKNNEFAHRADQAKTSGEEKGKGGMEEIDDRGHADDL